jgi:hypothetical protein
MSHFEFGSIVYVETKICLVIFNVFMRYVLHIVDLAKEIEAAHDDPLKELYLLRGFFFWLSVSILRQYVFLCIYLKIFNFNTLQDVCVEKYVARGG